MLVGMVETENLILMEFIYTLLLHQVDLIQLNKMVKPKVAPLEEVEVEEVDLD